MNTPYYPFYPKDYEAKTAHLTLAEDGVYNRLLRLCWMTPGCSIPNDDKWIMRRLRVTPSEFEDVVKVVLDEFFKCKKGRFFDPRLMEEFKKVSETYLKRSNAGKKGGRPQATENKQNGVKAGFAFDKAGPKQPEPEPEPYKKEPKGSKKVERPADVDPDLWSDFLAHRRSHRATLTETALKGFEREATKAKLTLSQAIRISIERGWRGFKADWIKPEDRPTNGAIEMSDHNPFKGKPPIIIDGLGQRDPASLYQLVHDHLVLGKEWQYASRLGTPGQADCKIPDEIIQAARESAAEHAATPRG